MNGLNHNTAGQECPPEVLEAFGLGSPSKVQPAGGTASPKWGVASAKGRFVVRLRPGDVAGAESVSFDHQALRRLSEAGLPVPTPLAKTDGSTWLSLGGRVYEVLHWVDGDPFDEKDRDAVVALGTFLARFHGVLGDDVPPGKAGTIREDHPDLLEQYLSGLRTLASDADDRQRLEQVAFQLDHVRRQLDAGLYASLPRCVIHGDLHPGNVRFRRREVAAVYDFDYLNVQARARDVIDGLMFFASTRRTLLDPDDIRSLTQPFVPQMDRCRLFLRGYQGEIRLTDAEWQALPLLMRSRWLQMRLRGCRKVAKSEKVTFVLDRFLEVIDWLDDHATTFFEELRAGL